jgi:hypothetical protein
MERILREELPKEGWLDRLQTTMYSVAALSAFTADWASVMEGSGLKDAEWLAATADKDCVQEMLFRVIGVLLLGLKTGGVKGVLASLSGDMRATMEEFADKSVASLTEDDFQALMSALDEEDVGSPTSDIEEDVELPAPSDSDESGSDDDSDGPLTRRRRERKARQAQEQSQAVRRSARGKLTRLQRKTRNLSNAAAGTSDSALPPLISLDDAPALGPSVPILGEYHGWFRVSGFTPNRQVAEPHLTTVVPDKRVAVSSSILARRASKPAEETVTAGQDTDGDTDDGAAPSDDEDEEEQPSAKTHLFGSLSRDVDQDTDRDTEDDEEGEATDSPSTPPQQNDRSQTTRQGSPVRRRLVPEAAVGSERDLSSFPDIGHELLCVFPSASCSALRKTAPARRLSHDEFWYCLRFACLDVIGKELRVPTPQYIRGEGKVWSESDYEEHWVGVVEQREGAIIERFNLRAASMRDEAQKNAAKLPAEVLRCLHDRSLAIAFSKRCAENLQPAAESMGLFPHDPPVEDSRWGVSVDHLVWDLKYSVDLVKKGFVAVLAMDRTVNRWFSVPPHHHLEPSKVALVSDGLPQEDDVRTLEILYAASEAVS